MNELLEPLAALPGVLMTALVTEDGVPVVVPGRGELGSEAADAAHPYRDPDVLAALTASWMDELARSVGQLSWNTPERAVLRAARGTLLLLPTSGALLVAVIDRGLRPDELWLSLEGAAARVRRHLRGMGGRGSAASGVDEEQDEEYPAALPRETKAETKEEERVNAPHDRGSSPGN